MAVGVGEDRGRAGGTGRAGIFLVGLALISAACGGSDGVTESPTDEPGPISAMRVIEGDAQSGPVGVELPQPLGVRLVDADGRGVPGRIVEFEVISGGGALQLSSSQTNAAGEARTRWTLGTTASAPQRVEGRTVDPATGAGFTVEFTATASAASPAVMTALSGSGQVAAAGETLPAPLVVGVSDQYGNVVPGVELSWEVTGGGGEIRPGSAATDAQGRAIAFWTLGQAVGAVHFARVTSSNGISATFWAESAVAGVWTQVTSLPMAVRAPAAAASGNRIYVIGGFGFEGRTARLQIFEAEEQRWSFGPDAPVATDWWGAAFLEGKLHVVGGVTAQAAASRQHWIYDPVAGTWSAGPSLPKAAAGSVVVSHDSKLYVFGGIEGPSAYAANTLIFDANTGAWSEGIPVPGARINWAGAPVGETILGVGGGTPGLNTTAELVSYDPRTGLWTQLPPIPQRREAHGAAVAAGSFCAMGGRLAAPGNLNQAMSSTYCYSPASGTWVAGPALPRARQEVVAVSVGGAIYLLGGRTSGGSPVADVTRLVVQ